MDSRINITILSDLNYENLLAEILIDGKFVGLVTNEPDKPVCFEISAGELKFSALELDLFQKALNLAEKELLQE
ncbi:hypothetical protein [Alteromonas sp. BMJM2]|jgi:hypothetical protein|uniref:hypothetical protein n=1 Tax=Alteromonas sp. BMJM2 TaxID=2954241 RepID=UPI0022B2B488|nr:hypothetical protein [Alteromonas sp. BMJM2]